MQHLLHEIKCLLNDHFMLHCMSLLCLCDETLLLIGCRRFLSRVVINHAVCLPTCICPKPVSCSTASLADLFGPVVYHRPVALSTIKLLVNLLGFHYRCRSTIIADCLTYSRRQTNYNLRHTVQYSGHGLKFNSS